MNSNYLLDSKSMKEDCAHFHGVTNTTDKKA